MAPAGDEAGVSGEDMMMNAQEGIPMLMSALEKGVPAAVRVRCCAVFSLALARARACVRARSLSLFLSFSRSLFLSLSLSLHTHTHTHTHTQVKARLSDDVLADSELCVARCQPLYDDDGMRVCILRLHTLHSFS